MNSTDSRFLVVVVEKDCVFQTSYGRSRLHFILIRLVCNCLVSLDRIGAHLINHILFNNKSNSIAEFNEDLIGMLLKWYSVCITYACYLLWRRSISCPPALSIQPILSSCFPFDIHPFCVCYRFST